MYKPVEQARLFLEHGAGPEVPIKGQGERGTTVLQHACGPTWGPPHPWRIQNTKEFAELVLAHGAYCDIYSACGHDDLDRVRELARQDPEAIAREGEAAMTPLHWTAACGSERPTMGT